MAVILDQFSLAGRAAIVTGAGAGMGEAMAIALAEAGADVAAVDYGNEPEKARREIERLGRKFLAMRADLTSIEPVPGIIEATVKAFGRLDILINCAGIIRRAPALEFSEKDWDDVMNVNLKTVFFLSQAAARQFVKQGWGGRIINIASMTSFQGGILIPSYTASKSGIRGLTQLLANEWAASGITVNAIAPGYMATANTAPLRRDRDRSAAILARIPAGRWGLPTDVQGAAVFLASDASAYVNGFTLAVDGGWLAR